MGQALYRKYRSKSLSELIGQEHITQTLERAIKEGRIAHAYLFTGPRGVGKTSTARILAHAINDLPYSDDQTHLDIIEIDAASNNSVEDVRDLREKVYVAPSVGKYKVYIIDEVHMLSKAAFNAILKTLEEPPAHAIFILATTEAHKLPDTIVSRTQRFVFRPISPEIAHAHLRTIADTEKIDITDEALELLAVHGDGSFRDSISLLDQASSLGKKIDAEAVRGLLGMPSSSTINALMATLTADPIQLAPALKALYDLYSQGFQASAIAHELSSQLRQALMSQKLAPKKQFVELLDQLLEVPTRRDPERYLEIVLLQLAEAPGVVSVSSAPAAPRLQTPPAPVVTKPAAAVKTPEVEKKPASVEAKASPAEDEKPKAAKKTKATAAVDETLWPQVLDALKKQYNTLYGIIRMAHVTFIDAENLELRFAFAFHQKRVNEAKNRQILSAIIEQLSGHNVQIVCMHDPELKSAKPTTASLATPQLAHVETTDASLSTISNIFGGGELLQS